ncbi:MAG: DUF3592 domain-containing protein [Paucimonas sp.]|jgi:hypothetical protein|nr:DUF3592 domain-containing protein [Paucimonas sp.]
MKFLAVMKYLFMVSGGLLLLGAAMSYHNTSTFLASALHAQGVVIDLEEHYGDGSVTYRPVVTFLDEQARPVRFTSALGSAPAAYGKGEAVTVRYLPNQPEDARIDSFFEHWGTVVVMLVVGIPFFLVGVLLALFGRRRTHNKAYLQKNGVVVQAQVREVLRNRSVSLNGKNPFVIVCEWLNPHTSQVHVFESENIWFEPSPYLGNEKIRVFIDKNNLRKYHVDISFLPKVVV